MQLWFKPYGQLLDMKRVETGDEASVPSFLVHLGIENVLGFCHHGQTMVDYGQLIRSIKALQ